MENAQIDFKKIAKNVLGKTEPETTIDVLAIVKHLTTIALHSNQASEKEVRIAMLAIDLLSEMNTE